MNKPTVHTTRFDYNSADKRFTGPLSSLKGDVPLAFDLTGAGKPITFELVGSFSFESGEGDSHYDFVSTNSMSDFKLTLHNDSDPPLNS